ncbi:MAG: tetratricopeptide repeat protein [Undibacterium sp.]|nr:tetratricopeptide repeat protein [Undibacterium sp.]
MTSINIKTTALDIALQKAIDHHHAGRFEDAEELYRFVLQEIPDQSDANHNLGILAGQLGKHDQGLPYLQRALAVNPDHEIYITSYAEALFVTGHNEEAIELLQNALNRGISTTAIQTLIQKIEPAINITRTKHGPDTANQSNPASKKSKHKLHVLPQAEVDNLINTFQSGRYTELENKARLLIEQFPNSGFVWKVLGTSLQAQGKDAFFALQKATLLLPNDAEAHNNLGVILKESGQPEKAVISCNLAIKLKPNFAEAHNNLGNALKDLGQHNAALLSYRRAIEIKPDLAEAHCNLGNTLKILGHPDSAIASYRRALKIKSTYAEAHCNLGVVLKELGQLEMAKASYLHAIEINPNYAEAHSNLGVVLTELRQFDAALVSCLAALAIKPDYAEAHCNLGNTQKELGQLDSAITSYLHALESKPNLTIAHINLGNALAESGQAENAANCYLNALAIEPENAEVYNNLGVTLANLGQLENAIVSYRRAIEIKPDFANAYSNLGNALKDLGQLHDAVDSYRQALSINPDDANVHNNLGNAQCDLGYLSDAISSYHRALELQPNLADAHNNLGNAFKDLGRLEDAVKSYRHAITLNPSFAGAHYNLGNVLTDLGQLDSAIECFRRSLEMNPNAFDARSALLFIQNYLSDQPADLLFKEALFFGNDASKRARPFIEWSNSVDPQRCLRIGLVSADFRNHPVGYFIESILAALASNAVGKIEIFAYSNHFLSDGLTERIKTNCSHWRSIVGLSDDIVAHQIRDDGIDILIDLSGHTAKNRLPMFAWKPAPVQVSWLGYFATTGLAAMDYIIADGWIAPESVKTHFVEKIQRMPESYLCFTPPDFDIQITPLPALSNGFVTFGCFNNLTKMNDKVITLWSRVLHAVPNSRLFLKTRSLNNPESRQKVTNRFSMHGIDTERLILEDAAPRAQLLAAYQRIDIALDPFPYPGGTTSVEALWMGIPVLNLAGDRFLSHMGESILQNAGLPDWIASNPDDYVALAISHTNDLQDLNHLHQQLRQQVLVSPLFDAPRFAENFENALRKMWSDWCHQQKRIMP